MEFLLRIKEFILESRRVLRITRKPDNEELRTIVKVSGIGILIIGLVGFLMQMVIQLSITWVK
ncbi:protein translocase SEC61 complex subunit gamma [Candidatus Woesearchaeota archaeon]|nr:protein translocase SEC61 complex subunit gamma [Candidatus Woesearchaeota archaeon]